MYTLSMYESFFSLLNYVIKLRVFYEPMHYELGYSFNKGAYMSAHVLLISLNEFRKRDKIRGSASILSLFRNEFNKFNITRARMLDSFYHKTLRLL